MRAAGSRRVSTYQATTRLPGSPRATSRTLRMRGSASNRSRLVRSLRLLAKKKFGLPGAPPMTPVERTPGQGVTAQGRASGDWLSSTKICVFSSPLASLR